MEPENSLEAILDGVVKGDTKSPILVVGNPSNKYGKYLLVNTKTSREYHIQGAVYDLDELNNLRHHSALYFHGHTVGGTNPSLLEAMACNCLICANDNEFNRDVLNDDAYFFRTSDEISMLLKNLQYGTPTNENMIVRNNSKIENLFNWERIVQLYDVHFNEIINFKK